MLAGLLLGWVDTSKHILFDITYASSIAIEKHKQ